MKKTISGLLTLLTVFALGHCELHAQSNRPVQNIAQISGITKAEDTDELMQYVNVLLLSAKDSSMVNGVITNEKGKFVITKVKNGNYILRLSFMGYKDLFRKVTVKGKNLDLGTLIMSPSSSTLNNVEIVAERQMMEYKLDKRVIDVDKNIVSTGGSASDVLENVPSVSVDEDGNVSLRGNSNVKVLIDGKPSELMGDDIATILAQIPASTISNVEVITNPSAKYDPEGMSGIINIKLKEKGDRGFSGNVNIAAGSAIETFMPRMNGSVALSYSTKKFGYSLSLDQRYNQRGRRNDNMKLLFGDNPGMLDAWMRSQRESMEESLGAGLNFSFDWYINDKNSLTLSYRVRGHNSPFDSTNIRNLNMLDRNFISSNMLDQVSNRTLDQITNGDDDGQFHTFSLNYQKRFKKPEQELMVDANFNIGSFNRSSDQILDYLNPTIPTYEKKDVSSNDNKRAVVYVNYSHPFSKSLRMEVGYNLNFSHRTSAYEYYINGSENKDLDMSYDFESTEYINALYATVGYSYGNWSGQLGLRGEIVTNEATKKMYDKDNDSFTKNYISPFPTLHLSYQLTQTQSMQFSYSRRINRPNMFTMMPNVDLSNPEHIRFGNPDINPEYTDAFEISHSIIFPKTTIFSSLYYRQTNDRISWFNFLWTEENARRYGFDWVLDIAGDEVDKGKLAMTSLNINKSMNYGLEFIIDQQITKWWKINLSANLFGNYSDATIINDSEIKYFTWDAKLNSTMNLPDNWVIQLSAQYFAPSETIQGNREAFYFGDIAIKKSINKQLSFSLRYSDMFRTMKRENTTITDDYLQFSVGRPYRQSVMLNFSYRFGSDKLLKKRQPSIKHLDDGSGSETGGATSED